jgi:hypothetical protein
LTVTPFELVAAAVAAVGATPEFNSTPTVGFDLRMAAAAWKNLLASDLRCSARAAACAALSAGEVGTKAALGAKLSGLVDDDDEDDEAAGAETRALAPNIIVLEGVRVAALLGDNEESVEVDEAEA